ncbi:hypothetical protein RchiOBHm_Chr4g0390121 [Rosa chinensis]|uniref:Uncharacterized protein n=1 Tax=Rosa chinensis TaxID=74649 RepID=A0A2P6QQ91_ROSCH|nr:hypothetical protein RchiOBHm_Chr4g0390121 [Rosa chinensis]
MVFDMVIGGCLAFNETRITAPPTTRLWIGFMARVTELILATFYLNSQLSDFLGGDCSCPNEGGCLGLQGTLE